MKQLFFVLILLTLTSCGNETFSPTYHDYVCVPANSALAWNPEYVSQPGGDNAYTPSSNNGCCENSGLVACCFGGEYLCADGSTGVGCGCSTN